MKNTTETSALSLLANDAGYDPLEDRLREHRNLLGHAPKHMHDELSEDQPPNRRLAPPRRSRHEEHYRDFRAFATGQ